MIMVAMNIIYIGIIQICIGRFKMYLDIWNILSRIILSLSFTCKFYEGSPIIPFFNYKDH